MPKGYHHLTRDQRCLLSYLNSSGAAINLIAKELGYSRSTIYRELKRNSGCLGYRAKQAEENTKRKRYWANHQRRKMRGRAAFTVVSKLKIQWSPQQISGWLKIKKKKTHVSHETIYKYIWYNKKVGGTIYKDLRRKGRKYNKRVKGTDNRGIIAGRIDIGERPRIVEEKKRVGDWELDTVQVHGKREAIVTMVDRATKLTKLAKENGISITEVIQGSL